MKAFLRNLLIGGIFALAAVQAQAAPPPGSVVWTFSGLPLTQLYDSDGNAVAGGATGGVQAGGTMTFDASGALLDYDFTTDGTPGPFGYHYTFATGEAFAPNDSSNPQFGAWSFSGLDDGAQHILALALSGDINLNWGSGPIPSVSIVPESSGEAYAKDNADYDGYFRLPGEMEVNPVVTAVRVPEPASMALLGTGLLLLGFASRRRKRRSV